MFFTFKITKLFTLYMVQVKADFKTALAATLAGLSLSYAIGRATLSGLFVGRKIPFIRTPKMATRVAVLYAMNAARDESVLALLLLCSVGLIYFNLGFESRENLAWCLVLVSQSLPFLASFVVALLSAAPGKAAVQGVEKTT